MSALSDQVVRKQICAALKSGTDDVYEIGKLLTPILLPMSLSEVIPLPATPIALAAISIIIARIGIAGLCANFKKD